MGPGIDNLRVGLYPGVSGWHAAGCGPDRAGASGPTPADGGGTPSGSVTDADDGGFRARAGSQVAEILGAA